MAVPDRWNIHFLKLWEHLTSHIICAPRIPDGTYYFQMNCTVANYNNYRSTMIAATDNMARNVCGKRQAVTLTQIRFIFNVGSTKHFNKTHHNTKQSTSPELVMLIIGCCKDLIAPLPNP